jgi:putative heme iron utilization protein
MSEPRPDHAVSERLSGAAGTPTGDDAEPFGADVVEAIREHMNADHAAESLVIVRALGDRPDAIAASMAGLDADGIDFMVITPDGADTVRLPWSTRLTQRADVRAEVVRMYQRAASTAP